MAVATFTAFADTVVQVGTTSACYVKGFFLTNPAYTGTDGWVTLYNASGATAGTTPDIALLVPFAAAPNKSSYRITFPRILFDSGLEAFISITSANGTSAWPSSAATGYLLDVYYEFA